MVRREVQLLKADTEQADAENDAAAGNADALDFDETDDAADSGDEQ